MYVISFLFFFFFLLFSLFFFFFFFFNDTATTEIYTLSLHDALPIYGGDPDPGRLVLTVTLATALPLWLGSPWWSWTTYLGCDWSEPDEGRHAALGSLRLRWPLQVAALPRPHQPERPGYPNLPDAKASVRTLVDQINQTAGPVLAKLEGGERR